MLVHIGRVKAASCPSIGLACHNMGSAAIYASFAVGGGGLPKVRRVTTWGQEIDESGVIKNAPLAPSGFICVRFSHV
jgi:hypothetical protein